MKKFRLHWTGGKTEIVQGNTIAEAFTRAGLGAGALRALDWYEEVAETPVKKERKGHDGRHRLH